MNIPSPQQTAIYFMTWLNNLVRMAPQKKGKKLIAQSFGIRRHIISFKCFDSLRIRQLYIYFCTGLVLFTYIDK